MGNAIQHHEHAGPKRSPGIADLYLGLADKNAVAVNIHPAVGSADQDANRALRRFLRLPEELSSRQRPG